MTRLKPLRYVFSKVCRGAIQVAPLLPIAPSSYEFNVERAVEHAC